MLALAYFSVSIGLATDKYTIHCVNAIPEEGHYVSQRYQFVDYKFLFKPPLSLIIFPGGSLTTSTMLHLCWAILDTWRYLQ